MEEVSEKKVRRKNRSKKSRHESDLELGAETASDAKVEHIISSNTKDDVWIEKENDADDKDLRRGKNMKESVNYFYFVLKSF